MLFLPMLRKIIILDFGSQYTQLIARRVRELQVYCEVHPYHSVLESESEFDGIIFSGSPCSVRDDNPIRPAMDWFSYGIPILGICYGAQLMALLNGGEVAPGKVREYGRAHLTGMRSSLLLDGVRTDSVVWMSHSDTIVRIPDNFEILASTESIPVAAMAHQSKPWYGLQFHPEVVHSAEGLTIIRNFLFGICRCEVNWTAGNFIENSIAGLRQQIGNKKVILGLSGGVDSSVAALLLHQAIGTQLHCLFVDHGLLRKNEFIEVLSSYQEMGLNVSGVDASGRFFSELKGVTDPETKRKIIGRVFVEVFEEESQKINDATFLAQGTIYPDVIESVSVNGPSVTIKSHHNVGGLPERMNLQVVEPLRNLFKDEVRRVGSALNLKSEILNRHPFPGPGLAIRILGAVDPDKVRMLQEADALFVDGLKEYGWYEKVWQAGVILLPVFSVGVMGDERSYEQVVALRAVSSSDGMTADWVEFPHSFLAEISNRIINRVKGVNRIVYDISSKPPATIEWE